jgi:hypothetical protein
VKSGTKLAKETGVEEKNIIILDPVSRPKTTKIRLNARPKNIVGLRVAMVDNTKPNFSIFCDRLEELLISQYKVASVTRYRKPGRTEPVAQQIIDDIKEKCDIAITGLGD